MLIAMRPTGNRPSSMPRRCLLAVALSFVLAAAVPVHAAVDLTFGLYASDKPTEMVKQFRPALDALEMRLSEMLAEPVEIHIHVASTYEGGIADIIEGRVDFSRLGPASYIEAKAANPDISILAVESKRGRKTFNGVVVVRQDSDILTVEDLKGRSFAFGNERSTIGRYLAQLYLMNHGILDSDLSTYAYLGRHDRVGAAVASGEYDAGALKERTFKKLVAKGMPLRVIAVFPNVTKPWIARGDLSVRLKDALSSALHDMDDPATLEALSKDGFLEGNDADYDVIRESIGRNGEFFELSSGAAADSIAVNSP